MLIDKLPLEAVGLRLGRYAKGDRLILCEPVVFVKGRPAVDMVLRRAAISGRVEIGGDIANHFADVMSDENTWIETVALDRKSYASLKNKWMRCRIAQEG